MIELSPNEAATFAIGALGAMQKHPELEALATIIDSLQPKIVVEIGVGKGGTAWLWSKYPSVETLILIDLPNGPWGGGPDQKSIEYIASNTRAHVHFIAGNSLNSETMAAVKATLGEGKIDFLHIDGDHSYAGVKSDFMLYEPLVRDGGCVALHDICEHAPETKCEVKKFWDELKETWPPEKYAEFIAEPTNWGGIGTLKK